MSEATSTPAGPSPNDDPLVPSGNPHPLPAGAVIATDADSWYYLEANYTNSDGKSVTGYAYPVGANASTSFWDYVVFNEGPPYETALRFKLSAPDGQGWARWNIHDDGYNSGYRLSCKATGWLYRASAYDVKFRVVDGKLYCNYWGGPAGSRYHSFLVSSGQYLGMGLPAFTCELEKAS